jgi:antitoxin component YwqK of YwqJK toxin-antitoxin module
MLGSWFRRELTMKKLLLIIPLVLFIASCSEQEFELSELNERQGVFYAPFEDKPYSGKVITTHDGHPASINGYIKNGKKDGVWRNWYASGQLENEWTLVNGEIDGMRRSWYKSGQLMSEGGYLNGNQEGVRRGWYENGQLMLESSFVNDRRDGVWTVWNKHGDVLSEETYVNSKCVSGCR